MKKFLGIIILVLGLLALIYFTREDNSSTKELGTNSIVQEEVVETTLPEQKISDTNQDKETMTKAIFNTNKGTFEIELFTDQTPKTTDNFIKLAESGFYNGVKFHRVIAGFMIQGGDPNTKDDNLMDMWGTGGPGYQFNDEFGEGLSNVVGTISMANSGPNTNGSQFFINVADNSFLDYDKEPLTSKHAVFGKVVSGMDVVQAISQVETGFRDIPVEPVVITSISISK